MNLGQFGGGLIAGFVASKIGPKKAILVGMIPTLVSYLMMALSPNVYTLVLGRLLSGVGSMFSLAKINETNF